MDLVKCILSDKKTTIRILVALIVICASIFCLESSSLIHDGDEVHSLIFSSNNRNNFEYLKNSEGLSLRAQEIKDLLFEQNDFNINEVFFSTVQEDVHPPLYYLTLHCINVFVNDIEISAYIFMMILLIILITFIHKNLKLRLYQAIWMVALIPNLIYVIPEIRPYFLLFIIAFIFYYLVKRQSESWKSLITLCVLLILGISCNYYFIFFVFSVLVAYSSGSFLKNKKFILMFLISLVFGLLFFQITGNQLSINTDLGNSINLMDRLTNFFIAFSAIFIPIWNIKLMGPEYFLFTFICSVLFIVVNVILFVRRYFSIFQLKTPDIRMFMIYITILFLLYVIGLTPHYAIGGKYFILASIPLLFYFYDKFSNDLPVFFKAYLILFFLCSLMGKVYFDSTENNEITKIIEDERELMVNKFDEFTVLRIVLEMKENTRITQENITDSALNSQKRYLLASKYLKNSNAIHKHRNIDSLVLNNYLVTCLYLDK